ncbi:unnamed protein product, partial [Symbiodinium pilosum]
SPTDQKDQNQRGQRRRGSRGGVRGLGRRKNDKPQATAAEWLDADREAVTVKTQWLDECPDRTSPLEPAPTAGWKPSLRPMDPALRQVRGL